MRRSVRLEFRTEDVVHGKKQGETAFSGLVAEAAGQIHFVFFHERLSNGFALGFQECVSHGAANEHAVSDLHEVFDDFDFVRDLRATKDGNEGPRGIGDRLAKIF